jgi:hypothetical protein
MLELERLANEIKHKWTHPAYALATKRPADKQGPADEERGILGARGMGEGQGLSLVNLEKDWPLSCRMVEAG